MSPLNTMLQGTYTAFLCSRIPNNHCETCSYFEPDTSRQYEDKNFTLQKGNNGGFTNCPSCGRCCRKVFVLEGDTENYPVQVPDSYITRPHLGLEKLRNKHPLLPRASYDPAYWQSYVLPDEIRNKTDRTESIRAYKPVIDEPDLDEDAPRKTVKVKLTF